jgi:hypothetical protein
MAKFFKGDWVRVIPKPDPRWKHWTTKHTQFCDQVVEVRQVEKSKNHPNVVFLCLKHFTGKTLVWFLDRHCAPEESYDRVFAANMQRATDILNRNEKVAKKCRDDILRDMFTPEEYLTDEDEDDHLFDEWDDDAVELRDEFEDELEEDWEDVVTKPIVPLPGRGKKIIRKAITNAKKKTNSIDTSTIDPTKWMGDEELTDYLNELIGDDDILLDWGDAD